jgi:hypothetical protein
VADELRWWDAQTLHGWVLTTERKRSQNSILNFANRSRNWASESVVAKTMY